MMATESKKVYQLQSSRRGDAFKNDDRWGYPKDQSNLEEWVEIGESCDSFEGKFSYRIVDQDGNFAWTAINAEYAPSINLLEPNWLDDIRGVYGVDGETFAAACRAWLEQHVSKDAAE